MLEYVMLLLVGLAGYADASWWLVPLAAGGLTIEGWWEKARLLRQHPRLPLSSKIVTYFVTGVIANIGFSALSFLCGRVVRRLLE